MRYDCLRKLLQTALDFYPDIPVIIADDTPDPDYESVNVTEFPNARQYKIAIFKQTYLERLENRVIFFSKPGTKLIMIKHD